MAFGTLVGDIKASPDYVWKAEALPDTTTKDSDTFQFGSAKGGVEIVCVNTGSAIASNAVKFEIFMDDVEADAVSGSSTYTFVPLDVTAAFAKDEVMFRFVPPSVDGMYASIRVTTEDDLSAESVTVYLHPIER